MTLRELRNEYPKLDKLCLSVEKMEKLAVAFSGGVDSTFLIKIAKECLGDSTIAITVNAPYIAGWEIDEAKALTSSIDVRHQFIELGISDTILNNPVDRCYKCKKIVFSKIIEFAANEGFSSVADGSNADDKKDYRPGMKALDELRVKSPLLENDITKEEIRTWSKALSLETWDKPPYACLLTRLPYNTIVDFKSLEMIERAEKTIIDMGIRAIRVRKHEDIARLEIGKDEMHKIFDLELMSNIAKVLKTIGFEYVTLDMGGYTMGSFNRTIEKGV
ncbi:MAG: ATP-dependent sacrificial sulfur transferase LarE [Clostridia bacterium]|nr:ATP-dependent sacrificial sulfur transferase LarE [Clostridia bacterium]